MRRHSTGEEVLIHKGDVEDVRETNLHNLARPRDLIRKVLLLEREVSALRETVDMMSQVNGFLAGSLRKMNESQLVELSEVASHFLERDAYEIDELLSFSEIFLTLADSDVVRLNDTMGTHDTWRVFYELCLKMTIFSRDGDLPIGKDLETAQVLLRRGLRNVRSIGVLHVENAAFLKTSRELLEDTLGHDLESFDLLMRKFKDGEPNDGIIPFVQNH